MKWAGVLEAVLGHPKKLVQPAQMLHREMSVVV